MPKVLFGEKLYNTHEAADILDVSYFTMKKYRQRGAVKGSKIGRDNWFSESELKRFVQEGGLHQVAS